ncbi:hypothetical protein DEH18_17000 [Streptomyces sp. NHF165]|nr:hypothetical protein DEH18_17000 [Streptomyces sp. NHF165]
MPAGTSWVAALPTAPAAPLTTRVDAGGRGEQADDALGGLGRGDGDGGDGARVREAGHRVLGGEVPDAVADLQDGARGVAADDDGQRQGQHLCEVTVADRPVERVDGEDTASADTALAVTALADTTRPPGTLRGHLRGRSIQTVSSRLPALALPW